MKERSLEGSALFLSPEDSHHIRTVLRLKVTDRIEIAETTTGRIFIAAINLLEPIVEVNIESEETALTANLPSPPRIVLLPALCKGDKNEQIVDWGTELGCDEIIFWPAEHSVVKLKTEKDRLAKEARFEKIGLAAAKQSRRPRPPIVRIGTSLIQTLKLPVSCGSTDRVAKFLCSLSDGATKLEKIQQKSQEIQIVVGPEGDLSQAEEETLCGEGFVPISLGSRVLRSELAVVTALVSIHYSFDI